MIFDFRLFFCYDSYLAVKFLTWLGRLAKPTYPSSCLGLRTAAAALEEEEEAEGVAEGRGRDQDEKELLCYEESAGQRPCLPEQPRQPAAAGA